MIYIELDIFRIHRKRLINVCGQKSMKQKGILRFFPHFQILALLRLCYNNHFIDFNGSLSFKFYKLIIYLYFLIERNNISFRDKYSENHIMLSAWIFIKHERF